MTGQLGILNKQGLSMGVTFALVNKGIELLQQAFQNVVKYIQEGVEMNREFEMSMARLQNSLSRFDTTGMNSIKDSLKNLSVAFGADINELTVSLRKLVQEGNSAADAMKMLGQAQLLATVSGEDLISTQETLNAAIEVFGLTAEDSGYIVNKLNAITQTAGMTYSQITQILTSASPEINKYGMSLEDVSNIIYTFDQRGYSAKRMVSELKTEIENIGKTGGLKDIFEIPEDQVKTLREQFEEAISDTAKFSSSMVQSFRTIEQMDLTKGLNIGTYFDQDKINRAKEYFNTLRSQGISTLEEFNSVVGQNALKELNNDFKYLGTFPKDIMQFIRTFYSLDDVLKESDKDARSFSQTLKDLKNTINTSTASIASYTASISSLEREMADIQEMTKYTSAMHDLEGEIQGLEQEEEILAAVKTRAALEIEMANEEEQKSYLIATHAITEAIKQQEDAEEKLQLQKDLAATTKQIADTTEQMDYLHVTHEITLEIQKQQDEVEKLQRISDQYSLSQQKNSLEILKIEYEAMGRRGGKLTRGEQYEISQIEQENALLHIQEMENQIAIGDIQTGAMQDTQDELDEIQRQHDESMYRSQIEDLSNTLSDMQEKWQEYSDELSGRSTSSLQSLNAQLEAIQAEHDEYLYNAELARLDQFIKDSQGEWQTCTDTINGIQTDALQLLNDQLDDLQAAHNEYLYNKELTDLAENLAQKQILLDDKNLQLTIQTNIVTDTTPIVEQAQQVVDTLSPLLNMWGITNPNPTITTGAPTTSTIPSWKWMQGGGHIYETGPYILHRGEKVLPSGKTENYRGNQITINISAVINKDMDVDTLAQKMRSAIHKNLLDGSGNSNYRLR